MWSHLERKPDGRWGNAASTPRDQKDPRYMTRLYSIRLTNAVRHWLQDHVPIMARSRWVEAAIVYCIELAKNRDLLNPFKAFRSGAYWGYCRGVVDGREESGHNVDAEIARALGGTRRGDCAVAAAALARTDAGPHDEHDPPAAGRDTRDGPDRRTTARARPKLRRGRAGSWGRSVGEGLRKVNSTGTPAATAPPMVWPFDDTNDTLQIRCCEALPRGLFPERSGSLPVGSPRSVRPACP